jgi:hypothetical protein
MQIGCDGKIGVTNLIGDQEVRFGNNPNKTLLVKKLFKLHFASSVLRSNISELDHLLTDKVARYKNMPDLQSF